MILVVAALIAAVAPLPSQPGYREQDILWRFESSHYPIMTQPGKAPRRIRSSDASR